MTDRIYKMQPPDQDRKEKKWPEDPREAAQMAIRWFKSAENHRRARQKELDQATKEVIKPLKDDIEAKKAIEERLKATIAHFLGQITDGPKNILYAGYLYSHKKATPKVIIDDEEKAMEEIRALGKKEFEACIDIPEPKPRISKSIFKALFGKSEAPRLNHVRIDPGEDTVSIKEK